MDKGTLVAIGGCTGLAIVLCSCSPPTNQIISAAELPNQVGQPIQPTQPLPVETPVAPNQVTGVVQVATPGGEPAVAPTTPTLPATPASPIPSTPQVPPPVSQDPKVVLAEKLASLNAVMYTCGWCPQCKRQEQMLGPDAYAKIKTVDCEKDVDICADKGVRAYPTWEINGQILESGMYPLQDLAQLARLDPTPYQDGSPSRINGGGEGRGERGEGRGEGRGRQRRGGMM